MEKNDESAPKEVVQDVPLLRRRGFLDYLGMELREMFVQKPPPPVRHLTNNSTDGIHNFCRVPLQLEMFIFYSMIVVIDIFLHTLVYLPLRAVRGSVIVAIDVILHILTGFARPIAANNLYDVVIGVVLVSTSFILYRAHAEEREETYLNTNSLIALAAITGIMETFDGLLSTFGADALDSLHSMFWISFGSDNKISLGTSWNELKDRKKMYQSQIEFTQQLRNRSRFVLSVMIVLICTVVHSLVLFMHMVCLVKAIERNSLLTILVIPPPPSTLRIILINTFITHRHPLTHSFDPPYPPSFNSSLSTTWRNYQKESVKNTQPSRCFHWQWPRQWNALKLSCLWCVWLLWVYVV